MWVISRLAPLLAKYTSIPTTIIRGAVPFVFMGFVNSWIWIYEVPIMISRLNSGLFAAAAQIFHPLRVWGRTFLGRYPLKNPLNSDKNQTGGVYQEVLTHLSLSTTWWSGTICKHHTRLTNGLHLNLPSICFSFLVDAQGLDTVWRFSGRSLPLVGGGGGSWPNVMQCVTR